MKTIIIVCLLALGIFSFTSCQKQDVECVESTLPYDTVIDSSTSVSYMRRTNMFYSEMDNRGPHIFFSNWTHAPHSSSYLSIVAKDGTIHKAYLISVEPMVANTNSKLDNECQYEMIFSVDASLLLDSTYVTPFIFDDYCSNYVIRGAGYKDNNGDGVDDFYLNYSHTSLTGQKGNFGAHPEAACQ